MKACYYMTVFQIQTGLAEIVLTLAQRSVNFKPMIHETMKDSVCSGERESRDQESSTPCTAHLRFGRFSATGQNVHCNQKEL